MLTDPHPDNRRRTLVEVSDLDLPEPPAEVAEHLPVLRRVVGWAREYLCSPHPELGRKGDVCPFAKTAIDDRTFYLTVQPGRDHPVSDVVGLLQAYRDWFLRMGAAADPVRAQFHTFLVVFPDLDPTDVRTVIDGAQARLKADFVAEGLMVGEFHDGPPASPGLWNSDFRPLRSPVPLLAIRHMVPSDLPFLRSDPEFLASYLHRFGGRVPAHLREQLSQAVDDFGLTPTPESSAGQAAAAMSGPGEPVALTPVQQRIAFLSTLDPGNPVQHVAKALRLTGPVDVPALEASLTATIAGNPVLRTVLADRGGVTVAATVAAPTEPVGVPLIAPRVGTGDGGVDHGDVDHLIARSIRRPFDLRRGPLLRAELLPLPDAQSVLVVTAHRLAADAAALDRICAVLCTAPAVAPGTPAAAGTGAQQLPAHDVPQPTEGDRQALAATLADLPTLDLPTDRRRPSVQSYRGALLRRRVGTADKVRLTSALIAVLARYTGQRDILLGLPRASASGIGPRRSTAVLRTSLAADETLRTLQDRCARALADIAAGGPVGLEDVLADLDVGHDLGVPPVFGVQLDLLDDAQTAPTAGAGVADHPVDPGVCEVDLSIRARPAADGAGADLEIAYSTDLFEAGTIDALITALAGLVGVGEPSGTAGDGRPGDLDTPLAALSLLAADHQQELLRSCTGPELPLPDPATPLTLLRRAAADHPDLTAVIGRDGELSYAELHRRAAHLAHLLQAWGVGPDAAVGVCVDRSAAMVVALLGVWMSGAAYVPLDPAFPPDRLRLMVQDADIAVVVTDRAARDRIGDLLRDVPGAICLDADADVLAQQPDTPPGVTVAPDDLAYLIYTSGSTGRPKGVEIPHRAVANLLVAFADVVPLGTDDRWLAVTTLSFDIAALELFHPLASGAGVVVATEAEAGDASLLARRVAAAGITALQATPAGWRLLLTAGPVPPGIRHRLVGGEAVPRDLADQLLSAGATAWNVYGPTETTVWSAAGVIAAAPAPIEIGPAIANTTLQVLDEQGRPTPPGVVGEVYIGGAGLARGYRNNSDLTAKRFVADPNRPGEKLYATGDLARLRPGGRLAFLGRTDHQVKVRGHRIELDEIEAALRSHPQVLQAAVSAAPGPGGEHRLVAYLVGVPGGSGSGAADWPAVQAWLRRSLPEYMVPGIAIQLDRLPSTPNGKLDRGALPDPAGQVEPVGRAAATAVERAVADLFAEVLDGPTPGADGDFFALGGHSLLGAKLLAVLRSRFDIEVPVRALFESPTVAGLAAALVEREPAPGQVTAIAELRERIAAMPDDEVAAMLADGEQPVALHDRTSR